MRKDGSAPRSMGGLRAVLPLRDGLTVLPAQWPNNDCFWGLGSDDDGGPAGQDVV
jgi:hypothetical protein